ncbi:hypothetical protein [Pyxidicoccus caerfyrddinensis]|uniref:hypothetical protein n=1 Tax=Pyxidicoccus caerfyrddinensis TaxID=2709663 RepID=UPI0013DC3A14|nr:hypothetical protein [Pyxidicoccus caerfyrddinensis]
MSKVFRPYAPEQSELLPPSPRDWLPAGHLAYFILDAVAELDLRPLLARDACRYWSRWWRTAAGCPGR